jgi:hypothetical protein
MRNKMSKILEWPIGLCDRSGALLGFWPNLRLEFSDRSITEQARCGTKFGPGVIGPT